MDVSHSNKNIYKYHLVVEFEPLKTVFTFFFLQGNTPEAQRIATELKKELEKLKSILQKGAVRGVVDNFKDILSPIKQLAKAAKAPMGKTLFRITAFPHLC